MDKLLPTLVGSGITLIIGIIGYFLKRTMGRVDKSELDITAIKETFVSQKSHEKALDECKADIKQIREDYTPKQTHEKDFDECRNDIKDIKEECITKEDFYRELSKVDKRLDNVDKKLDRITDLILGGNK